MEREVKEEAQEGRRCNKELVKKVIKIKFDSVGIR